MGSPYQVISARVHFAKVFVCFDWNSLFRTDSSAAERRRQGVQPVQDDAGPQAS